MAQDIKAGGAYVELMLKNKRFTQGLKSSGKQLLAFGKMAVVAGAAMAAAAVAGAAVAVRQYIKMGDQLDKMSKRTGVSVEALSELKQAATLSGGSANDLEKGFAGLSRSLFDAARGSKEANDALGAAGVSLKELQGLNPEDQMARIADGLQGIADESTRGAVAQRVFGRAGRQLLPMLREGSKGMEAMRQQARDAGLTMSTEAAEGAARLLDAFTLVGGQLKTLAFEIGGAVAPFIEVALPVVQRFGAMTIGAVRSAGEFIRSNVGGVVGYVSGAWQSLYGFLAPIFSAYATTAYDAFTAVWGVVKQAMDAIGGYIGAVWSNVMGTTGGFLSWMQETTINNLARVSFAFKNWRLLVHRSAVGATLGVVQFAAETSHFFTEVIPAHLKWFFNNWRDVFTDVMNMTKTIAGNIGTNLANLWKGIKSLFSGGGFQFEWTDLTKGFESAIKELPQVAARQAGPVEKALQAEFDRINSNLKQKWEGHQAEFKARVQANTPDNPFKFDGPGGIGRVDPAKFDGGGAFGAQDRQKQVLGAFSLAALQGGAGGPERTLKEILKEQREARKQQRAEARMMREAMNGGLT